jgi:plasmid stabilization system protein ParE
VKWPRIEPDAVRDMEKAVAYFAQQSLEHKAAFAKSLREALSQIAKAPRRHARLETNKTDREIRRVIIPRFRYLVIFEMMRETPRVLAVMHASQEPNAWQRDDSCD